MIRVVDSLKAAAALVAEDLLTFYPISTPGWVPGILPGPPPDGDYYWWQGGAMWGALMDYRAHTDDDTYDDTISTAMLWQVGPDKDFMPVNWSASMGNDDQAFWALSAMLAAETGFPDPPEDQAQWLALAQAVFNEQTQPERRVDSGTCEWGLRWQVFSTNNGYNYINSTSNQYFSFPPPILHIACAHDNDTRDINTNHLAIANACYFNIGTRLARYLDNTTYSDLADRTFTLIHDLGYISDAWDVYDGAHLPNCSDINKAQFSYNAALLIQGCAFMYNYVRVSSTHPFSFSFFYFILLI